MQWLAAIVFFYFWEAELGLNIAEIVKRSHATIETGFAAQPVLQTRQENLKSVFYNLLINLLKYKHWPPHIKIVSGIEENFIFLSVTDSGIGIDLRGNEEKLFRRLHEYVEGSGVGLYIVSALWITMMAALWLPCSRAGNHV